MAFSNFLIRAYESGEGGNSTAEAKEKQMAEERCSSIFGQDQCEKRRYHKGKHSSFLGPNGEIQSVQWTDAGLREFLKELEAEKR